jgi:hypothetical protein
MQEETTMHRMQHWSLRTWICQNRFNKQSKPPAASPLEASTDSHKIVAQDEEPRRCPHVTVINCFDRRDRLAHPQRVLISPCKAMASSWSLKRQNAATIWITFLQTLWIGKRWVNTYLPISTHRGWQMKEAWEMSRGTVLPYPSAEWTTVKLTTHLWRQALLTIHSHWLGRKGAAWKSARLISWRIQRMMMSEKTRNYETRKQRTLAVSLQMDASSIRRK